MSESQAEYVTESEEALQMLGKGYNSDPIPPTQFVSTLSGFTPVPDILIKEYGYVTALVWGRMWRFCQMADGVCRASLEKIGAMIGMSERTIIRHSEILCQGGYLFDMTPELRNKPHIYADTGKLKIRVNVESGMTESQRDYDSKSHEESTTKGEVSKNIFTLYENNIGILTPMIANSLIDAENTYPAEWIIEAFQLAVENNKRNWRYCETILKRWKTDGKDEGKGKPHKTDETRPEYQPFPFQENQP